MCEWSAQYSVEKNVAVTGLNYKSYCEMILWECCMISVRPGSLQPLPWEHPPSQNVLNTRSCPHVQVFQRRSSSGKFSSVSSSVRLFKYLSMTTAQVWHIKNTNKNQPFANLLIQGCSNPGHSFTQATKFCIMAPNICRSSAWNLLRNTILAPRILRWLLHLKKKISVSLL
jgi:hypothetical protein